MRSRIVTSGIVAAAGVAVLGLSFPASAADEVGTSGDTVETVEQTAEEELDTEEVADDLDEAVSSTEDTVDDTSSDAPDPVAETVDETTDTVTETTDALTDTLQTPDEPTEPTEPTDPDGTDDKDQRGAGDDATTAPSPETPSGLTSAATSTAGGDAPGRAPNRLALDGFRRTSTSDGSSSELAVTADPLTEPEPLFAPPTTQDVVEPTATAAQPLPLRSVAAEILLATALLVLATGGLVAELGPERA